MLWFTYQIKSIVLGVIVAVMYSEKLKRISINAMLVNGFGLGKNDYPTLAR